MKFLSEKSLTFPEQLLVLIEIYYISEVTLCGQMALCHRK